MLLFSSLVHNHEYIVSFKVRVKWTITRRVLSISVKGDRPVYIGQSILPRLDALMPQWRGVCGLRAGFSMAVLYYAALLPRRGPHIASHSVCPSVCLSVRPVIINERHVAPPSELK